MVSLERDVEMRTSDGVSLLADVYRPEAQGPLPVLLVRLPYDKRTGAMFHYAPPQWYAKHSYVVVLQDTRGRYASDGTFMPLFDERRDSYEAVEWAARLPGTTGQVGMYGGSYLGWVQLAAAVAQPPHLAAMAPAVISPDAHRWAWRGGAFNLHFALSWMLEVGWDRLERAGRSEDGARLAEALACFGLVRTHQPLLDHKLVRDPSIGDFVRTWMAHPDAGDPFWAPVDFAPQLDRISAPGLHIGGWYDMFVEGTIAAFRGAQAAHGRQRLLLGPWLHCPWIREVGALDFGSDAANPVDDLQIRWFDRWLKGERNAVDEEPPVEAFIMGANYWWRGSEFPPPNAVEQRWFLSSEGRANGSAGDGALTREARGGEPADHYYYDPLNPFPSIGGRSCCSPAAAPMGPYDQSEIHRYPAALIYASEPLAEPLTVLGFVRAELFFASSAPDTDLVVQLCDHHPDGRVINVLEGIQRVRGANGGQVEIELGATGIRFGRGHRIRIAVTSSLFPAYDRNHNNGRRDVDGGPGGAVIASQTVLHDALHPSQIVLSVIQEP